MLNLATTGNTVDGQLATPDTNLLEQTHSSTGGKRVFILFALSSVALSVATMLAGLVVLRWIEPAAMGIWQTLLLVQAYLSVIRLGALNGMNLELPYLLGKGDKATGYQVAETAQFFILVSSVIGAIGFLGALWVLWPWGEQWRVGLAAMVLYTLTSFYLSYLQGTFRSTTEFRRLVYLQCVQAILVLSVPLFASFWGYTGLCIHYAGQSIILTAFAHLIRPIRVWPKFNFRTTKLLLRTALPLFVTNYMYILAMGFDRIILLQRGNTEAVGYYTPSIWVLSGMAVIPSALSMYVYPRMSFRFGQRNNPRELWRTSVGAIATSMACGVPIVIIGWISAPWLVQHLFPDYLPSLSAIRISFLTGLLLSVLPGTAVLRTLRAWRLLYLYTGTFLVTKWIFPWYFSQGQDPITQVALGTFVAAVISVGVAVWACFKATHRSAVIGKLAS